MAPFIHIHLIISFILSKKRRLRCFSLLVSIYFLSKQTGGWTVLKPHPQQKPEHRHPNCHPLLASCFFAIVSCDLLSSHIRWVSWKTKNEERRPPLTSSCLTGQRKTERMQRVIRLHLHLQMLRKDMKTVHSGMDASLCHGCSPLFLR